MIFTHAYEPVEAVALEDLRFVAGVIHYAVKTSGGDVEEAAQRLGVDAESLSALSEQLGQLERAASPEMKDYSDHFGVSSVLGWLTRANARKPAGPTVAAPIDTVRWRTTVPASVTDGAGRGA